MGGGWIDSRVRLIDQNGSGETAESSRYSWNLDDLTEQLVVLTVTDRPKAIGEERISCQMKLGRTLKHRRPNRGPHNLERQRTKASFVSTPGSTSMFGFDLGKTILIQTERAVARHADDIARSRY